MCEIAVLDPRNVDFDAALELLRRMYATNDDGLGLVAVTRDGDQFAYDTYVAETPEWAAVSAFLSEQLADESAGQAWRVVAHCRLATAGGVGVEQSHPIKVPCSECEPQMVVHNGHVTGGEHVAKDYSDEGHEIKTAVDSEVIAHSWESLPESLDEGFDGTDLHGTLNYLVFGRDRILCRFTRKYATADDWRVYLRRRELAKRLDADTVNKWLLVTPDGVESQTFTSAYRDTTTRRRGRWTMRGSRDPSYVYIRFKNDRLRQKAARQVGRQSSSCVHLDRDAEHNILGAWYDVSKFDYLEQSLWKSRVLDGDAAFAEHDSEGRVAPPAYAIGDGAACTGGGACDVAPPDDERDGRDGQTDDSRGDGGRGLSGAIARYTRR